jgi:hypothetical protein
MVGGFNVKNGAIAAENKKTEACGSGSGKGHRRTYHHKPDPVA